MSMSQKILEDIIGLPNTVPESFGNSDLAVFKPRFFVEGENQFDYYHFATPRVEIPCFYADKNEISIQKYSLLPTNPGQKLKMPPIDKMYDLSDDIKFLCLFITPGKMQEVTKEAFNKSELSFYNEAAYLSKSLLTLISNFEMEFHNRQFGYQFVLDSLSMEITINLVRSLRNNMAEMPELKRYAAKKEINSAIDYLWENYTTEFSLAMLSRIANLSPYYFIRLFKAQTGKTPYDYYMEIKINKALMYLKSKEYSITEVGYLRIFKS